MYSLKICILPTSFFLLHNPIFMLFITIVLQLISINTASAATSVETYSSATANSGGNSGTGSIQTGSASASSTVENKINSENGTSTVKTEVKAEANGKKEEKKVEKTVGSDQATVTREEVNVNAESMGNNDRVDPSTPQGIAQDDNIIQNENIEVPKPASLADQQIIDETDVQNQKGENNNQQGFVNKVVGSVKNFFNKLISIFS